MRYGHLIPKIYPTGVFIESIEQTETSTESGGKNVITATLTNHTQQRFEIQNGEKGDVGPAATIKEITASVDNSVGTPAVTVSESGAGTEKTVHFDFKSLKGEKGEPGEAFLNEKVTQHIDSSVEKIGKQIHERVSDFEQDMKKQVKQDIEKQVLMASRMPLNPVAAYDMADVLNKKRELYAVSNPIVGIKDVTVIGAQKIHEAHKKGTFYHIHSEMSYTGNSIPIVIVYREDWKETLLHEACVGSNDFTVFIPQQNYNFGIGVWMNGFVGYEVQPADSVNVYKFTVTELQNSILIDSSGNGNHAIVSGNVMQVKDVAVGAALSFTRGSLTRAPLDCIGVGKKWSHSRWIYVNAQKDKNKELYLWVYSDYDYCYTNMVKDDGIVSTLYVTTAREGGEKNTITVPVPDHWLHLVVMTDLQETSCRKIVYANGKKIDDKTINGNFKGWLGDNEHTDMWYRNRWVLGSLANQLFFDRHLTEAEILWLGRNPYYPAKRYSLAEYKADENRKLIEALKKG